MKKLTLVFALLLTLVCCTTEADRNRMRAGLDSLNQRNRNYETLSVAEVQPYVDFFTHHGTPNDRVLANYLLGRAYDDSGEAPMALKCFHKAIEVADTSNKDCEFAQLSRVYSQMAQIFYSQGIYRENLKYLEFSIRYAWQAKDTIAALITYEQKAHSFRLLNMPDSAINICTTVSNLYRKYGYPTYAAAALSTCMRPLMEKGKYDIVGSYMQQYEDETGFFDVDNNIQSGREIYYNLKGLYNMGIGRLDSAEYFFRKELREGKNINDQNAGSLGLAMLYHKTHLPDSAAKYALYAYAMNDSVYAHQVSKDVERLQVMYNFTRYQETARVESEKATHRIMYIWVCLAVILMLLLLLLLGFFLYYRSVQNRKHVESLYHHSSTIIKQARQDIVKLQLHQKLNEELISKKERVVKEQEKTIKDLLAKEKSSRELAANDFKTTGIYGEFKKSIGMGKDLTRGEWVEFQDAMFKSYPGFSEFISQHCDNMSENEYKICLLIRADFRPVSIGAALQISASTMTYIRKELLDKLFKITGNSKDFDRILKSIY